MELLVDNFLKFLETIQEEKCEEDKLDEETYIIEQEAFCHTLPLSNGHLVYNALVFFSHPDSSTSFGPDWVKQHTTARLVFISLGCGYEVVLMSTLSDALQFLDKITLKTHHFYKETNGRNIIPVDETFVEKVRHWHPVWCANELFVRFATSADRIIEYPVIYSDNYDVSNEDSKCQPIVFKPAVHYASICTNELSSNKEPNNLNNNSTFENHSNTTTMNGTITNGSKPEIKIEMKEGANIENQQNTIDGLKLKYSSQDMDKSKRIKEATKGLPIGWRAFIDKSGNLYYGNTQTNESSWTRPTS